MQAFLQKDKVFTTISSVMEGQVLQFPGNLFVVSELAARHKLTSLDHYILALLLKISFNTKLALIEATCVISGLIH